MSRFPLGKQVHDALRALTFSFFRRYIPARSILFGDSASWLALSSLLPLHEVVRPPLELAALYDWNTALTGRPVWKLGSSDTDSLKHFVFLLSEEVPSLFDDTIIARISSRVVEYLELATEGADQHASLALPDGLEIRILILTTWTNADAARTQQARHGRSGTGHAFVSASGALGRPSEVAQDHEELLDQFYPYAALKEQIERQVHRRYVENCALCSAEQPRPPAGQRCQHARRELSVQCWTLYAPFLAVSSAFPSQNLGAIMLGNRAWYHCIGFPSDIRVWTRTETIIRQSQNDLLADTSLRLARQVAAFCAALKCRCSGAFVSGNAPVATAVARLFLDSLENAESEMADLELPDYAGMRMEESRSFASSTASSGAGVCVLFLDRLTDVASAVYHRNGIDSACHDWFGRILSTEKHVLRDAAHRILKPAPGSTSDLQWFLGPFGGIAGNRALLSTSSFTEEMLQRQDNVDAFLSFVGAELALIAERLPSACETVQQGVAAEPAHPQTMPLLNRSVRSKLGAMRLSGGRAPASSTASRSSDQSRVSAPALSARAVDSPQSERHQVLVDLVQRTRSMLENVWHSLEPRQRVRYCGLLIYAWAAVHCAEMIVKASCSDRAERADTQASNYNEQRLWSLFQLVQHWSMRRVRVDEIIEELVDIILNQDLHQIVLPFLVYSSALLNWAEELSDPTRARICGALAEAATRARNRWLHDTAAPLVGRLCELSAISSRNFTTSQDLMANWRNWLRGLSSERNDGECAQPVVGETDLENQVLPALVHACLDGKTSDLHFYPRRRIGTLAALGEIFGVHREHAKTSSGVSRTSSLRDYALVLVCATNGLTVAELRAFQKLARFQDFDQPKFVLLHSGMEFVARDTLMSVCFGVESDSVSSTSSVPD
ncbi:hypothetical protein CCYA_CCYA09G2661 [Cyanidiococcus yangmingshanensis]|nr:hypothetical protein CCYA_CCYA09G2661 [Cyanidiococcus yangmingshanensis]